MSDDDDGSTFSIRLVDEDGHAVGNREVTCFYPGGLLPGGSHTEYTDDDGWCEFPTFGSSSVTKIYSYELHGIWVSKRSVLLSDGEYISDGATFSFTVIDE
jgi:hypothetical protein